MRPAAAFELILVLLLIALNSNHVTSRQTRDKALISQRNGDANNAPDDDEGSCICGLNMEILSKIESIVSAAKQDQACSVPIGDGPEPTSQDQADRDQAKPIQIDGLSADGDEDLMQREDQTPSEESISNETPPETTHAGGNADVPAESLIAKLTAEIHALEAQVLSSLHLQNHHSDKVDPQTSQPTSGTVWKPEQQEQQLQPSEDQPASTSSPWHIRPTVSSETVEAELVPSVESNQQEVTSTPAEVGQQAGGHEPNSFVHGLTTSTINLSLTHQFSDLHPNRPDHNGTANIQAIESTVESTVPNVVSNIFSNIQDFAVQTEQNPNADSSLNTLTSIDGTSVNINAYETSDEITAQGEHLFMDWVDRQIKALHMTASMAQYIRKSALNLFRRIVRQYVERISKLGGRVEDNVRRATQTALNNTQTLTSFLMRNYMNFAGGLMQMIGEQVSRVGKQLDSTGSTIAQVNPNPFDIVSNVIESLPNPSRYSEYFRAFGKYLMGEAQPGNIGEQNQNEPAGERKRGLLSKTMGALGKTLGSWLGR